MRYQSEDDKIVILNGDYRILQFDKPADFNDIVELDLGCGRGSFTSELARLHPQRLVLAADIMIGRLRKLAGRNHRENINNVIPLRVEAGPLLSFMLPDNTIDRLHILCPDPWPKGKHRGNRLISSNLLRHLHRVLKPGGIFHFSTDDIGYYEHVMKVVSLSDLFNPINPQPDISELKTDFEERWNQQGKVVQHRYWQRL